MGIFNRFPYSSTHEMNLDFMLGKAQEINEQLQNVQTGMQEVQTGLSQISEQTERATAAATAAEEAKEDSQQNERDAFAWAEQAEQHADRAAAALSQLSDEVDRAEAAADRAEAAADAASISASAASNSANIASQNAATAAQQAANAQLSAQSAQGALNQATVAANNAQTNAVSAADAAALASGYNANAATSATNAATSATNAATSAASVLGVEQNVQNLVESIPTDYSTLSNDVNDLKRSKVSKEPINLIDTSTSVVGTINYDGSIISTSTSYKTTDYIYVKKGVTYTVTPAARFALFFYTDMQVVDGTYMGEYTPNYTFTPSDDRYVRVSYMLSSESTIAMKSYVDAADKKIEEGVSLSNYQLNQVSGMMGNILFGKKWWACGDSFTEWTTEQFDATKYPNITVVDDRFHYATYPFWIGARNNMTVHNFAVSGQTMAYPTVKYDGSPSSFQNAFANGKYQTIPTDVDYITLWFGINDSHHRPGSQGGDGEPNEGIITIGTIDDTATNTFYGAWNTVLEYLITNHPWAKIGIIITNGAETNEYAQAEIDVAKKWGIPYLDLNGDYKLPLMLRVDGKPDVCAEAVTIRKNQQWANVAQGNGHPNVNAHKFESTFIENWLRSI